MQRRLLSILTFVSAHNAQERAERAEWAVLHGNLATMLVSCGPHPTRPGKARRPGCDSEGEGAMRKPYRQKTVFLCVKYESLLLI